MEQPTADRLSSEGQKETQCAFHLAQLVVILKFQHNNNHISITTTLVSPMLG